MKSNVKGKRVLITGGAGFLGSHLVSYLKNKNVEIIVMDKLINENNEEIKNTTYFKGNILSKKDVRMVFEKYGPFQNVYHLAAEMPNKVSPANILWRTNVDGTVNLVSEAVKNKTESFIFTSSNVAYGVPETLPIKEKTLLIPLEIYGKSKAQAERELILFKNKINIQIFRCPVISGVGRLGLQAILFEFISENKNIYVLGDGSNKYQFVDADDVCAALELASRGTGFEIYNIGADEIITLREMYQRVIDFAGSTSSIITLPKTPALIMLAILDKLNVSPLGVYQYSMLGRSLYMDTTKIKNKLGWKPKKTNVDTFIDNYKWYIKHKDSFIEIGSGNYSSNRSLPKMKAFKLLKWLS